MAEAISPKWAQVRIISLIDYYLFVYLFFLLSCEKWLCVHSFLHFVHWMSGMIAIWRLIYAGFRASGRCVVCDGRSGACSSSSFHCSLSWSFAETLQRLSGTVVYEHLHIFLRILSSFYINFLNVFVISFDIFPVLERSPSPGSCKWSWRQQVPPCNILQASVGYSWSCLEIWLENPLSYFQGIVIFEND